MSDDDALHVALRLKALADPACVKIVSYLCIRRNHGGSNLPRVCSAVRGCYPFAPGVCWVSPIRCASQGSSCVSAAENKRQSCDPGSSM